MRIITLFIIYCLILGSSFADSKRSIQGLYSSYLKGLFQAESGLYDESLAYLEEARKRNAESSHIRLKIASILIRQGEIKKAEKELLIAKDIDPQGIDASLALIFLYSYTQRDEDLEIEYEDFLKRSYQNKPEDLRVSEYLAQFYFYKDRIPESLEIYKKIVSDNPDYVDAIFWLGYLYEEVGKVSEAVSIWEKGLAVEPDNAPILNSLGYTYAEQGQNLDTAEEMIKKALAKEPDNGAYLDSLGWLYFQKKNYKQAEDYLKRAAFALKDPIVYEHLGDLYAALNKRAEAIQYYNEGLKYFPDSLTLQEKVKKYEQQ